MIRNCLFLSLLLALIVLAPSTRAQDQAAPTSQSPSEVVSGLPDAPSVSLQDQPQSIKPADQEQAYEGKQTRRILGIVPNFRSVSVDEKLPPLSLHEKFNLSLDDNFDYSSFIYVGLLAGIAQTENSFPEFHHGAPAYARYYWHSFSDTIDGNLMTEFLLPVATKEDPRYYTLGHGGILKRTEYAITRLAVTRTDSDGRAFNLSEVVGNGAAAGISNLYYPGQERTWTKTGQRWVTQVGLDGASNLVKEFWPDVNSRFFHNKY
jgi:hypothetical protein